MTREERIEALKENGIDVSKLFCIDNSGDEDSAPDTTETEIREAGYIANSRLFRRWVMAQYMRLYYAAKNNGQDIQTYVAKSYKNYGYHLRMIEHELEVQLILQVEDPIGYEERSHFFNKDVVSAVYGYYVQNAMTYIRSKVRGVSKCVEVTLAGRRLRRDRVAREIITQMNLCYERIRAARDLKELHDAVKRFNNNVIDIGSYNRIKQVCYALPATVWAKEFTEEGAYYTLVNMVKFHGTSLDGHASGEDAYQYLRGLLNYRGSGSISFVTLLDNVIG